MENNRKRTLDVLRTELAFIEIGGYSAWPAWEPKLIFEDSPTCMNYGHGANRKTCSECALMQFVPKEYELQKRACRFIPLNAGGETLDQMYHYAGAKEIEDAVTCWLKTTVAELNKPEA